MTQQEKLIQLLEKVWPDGWATLPDGVSEGSKVLFANENGRMILLPDEIILQPAPGEDLEAGFLDDWSWEEEYEGYSIDSDSFSDWSSNAMLAMGVCDKRFGLVFNPSLSDWEKSGLFDELGEVHDNLTKDEGAHKLAQLWGLEVN